MQVRFLRSRCTNITNNLRERSSIPFSTVWIFFRESHPWTAEQYVFVLQLHYEPAITEGGASSQAPTVHIWILLLAGSLSLTTIWQVKDLPQPGR